MERLTHKDSEGWYIEDQSIHFDMRRRGKEINRLAAYEDTGLTPEEVVRLMEMQQEVCKACGRKESLDFCEYENCAGYQWRAYWRRREEAQREEGGDKRDDGLAGKHPADQRG